MITFAVRQFILAIVGFLAVASASAEIVTLHLRNGDRLSGTFISEDTNRVVIGTSWQKELSVPKTEISRRETNLQTVPAEMPKAPAPVVAAPVKAPPPVVAKPPKHWAADLQFGLDIQESTKDRTLYYTRDKLTYGQALAKDRDKFRSIIDYSYSYGTTDGVRSTDQMNGSAKVDYDLGKRLFLYNLAGAGYDKIRKIDLQYEEGPGVGVHALTLTNFVLNTEVGMNYQAQQFSDRTESKNFYYRLAEDLTWKVNSRIDLVQKVEFFPQADTLEKFHLRFDSTLRYALFHNLSFNFSVINLYDSRPAAGVDSNDLQLRSSIGVRF